MTPTPAPSGISVTTRVFPLAFLLLLFKTTVTIDGTPNVLRWGEHFFPVAPGTHSVYVTFKYLFGDMGGNGVTVEVPAGQVVRVHYRSPWLVFLKGRITIDQSA